MFTKITNVTAHALADALRDVAHASASEKAEAAAVALSDASAKADALRAEAVRLASDAEAARNVADAAKAEAADASAKAARARTPATREAKAARADALRKEAARLDAAATRAEAEARKAAHVADAARADVARLSDALDAARADVPAVAARIVEGRDVYAVLRESTPEDAAAAVAEKAAAVARLAAEDVAAAVEAGDASRRAEAKAAKAEAARLNREAVEARKAAKAAAAVAPRLRFSLGVNVSDARPGDALRDAHALASAVVSRLALDVAAVAVYFDADAHALAAARAVAKRTAANGARRNPSPLSLRLDADARAGRWDADGLGDMIGEAAVVFASARADVRAEAARDAARKADALERLAASLRKYGPGDGVANAAAYNVAAYGVAVCNARPASDVLPDASEDARTARRRALAARALADALATEDAAARAEAVTLAAYRAVNGYLSDVRAGRASETPDALDVATLADVLPDARAEYGPDALGDFEATRRDVIRAAASEAVPALSDASRRTLAALIRAGGNVHAAARRLNRNPGTVVHARDAVARTFSDALAHVAPESLEALALSAYVEDAAEAEAADAAARLAARKARNASNARKAEAKGRASDVEAGEAAREAEAAAYFSDALAAAVARLSDARRAVVRLALSGASQREAAAVLGKSRAAVREAARGAAGAILDALGGADALGLEAADAAARGDVLALAEAVRAALA